MNSHRISLIQFLKISISNSCYTEDQVRCTDFIGDTAAPSLMLKKIWLLRMGSGVYCAN